MGTIDVHLPSSEAESGSSIESASSVSQREQMVNTQIVARGIQDPAVIQALLSVPRERFLDASIAGNAYDDRALGIECGQTISQPYIVAFMSELLEVGRGHRVLEIGTGSGYQTAILAMLANAVFTVERHAELSQTAQSRLKSFGFTIVRFSIGDGTMGWKEHAPFDRILVTASAPNVTLALTDQLAEGGRLLMPVGDQDGQIITLIEKQNGRLIERPSIPVRFVKLIGEAGFHE